MGRSLRRIKRSRPKIIKRKSKTRFTKSKIPHELKKGSEALEDKLGAELEWDESKHLKDNYEESGFVMDPNEGHGRKTRGGINPETEVKSDEDLDDDLRVTLGKQSLIHGPAAPKRPTDRQRRVIAELQKVHGDDVAAMMMDHKRNKMQLSAGALKELIRACEYWAPGSGVDFRVPVKSLWTK
ncbi:hypothetical protein PSENEW3_00000260 [Picochlorum sp. SENEW3]|nr:hypothetical protein PSENEW3_00000260 [Picochlorum sp. SENEW3]